MKTTLALLSFALILAPGCSESDPLEEGEKTAILGGDFGWNGPDGDTYSWYLPDDAEAHCLIAPWPPASGEARFHVSSIMSDLAVKMVERVEVQVTRRPESAGAWQQVPAGYSDEVEDQFETTIRFEPGTNFVHVRLHLVRGQGFEDIEPWKIKVQ